MIQKIFNYVIILLLIVRTLGLSFVYADTPTITPTDTPAATITPTDTPTDSPTPTVSPSPTDTPTPTDTPSVTPTPTVDPSITGTVVTPTPTDTPTPTPDPSSLVASNSANVTNNASSSATSGDNSITVTDTPTPSNPSPASSGNSSPNTSSNTTGSSSSIATGNATSATTVENIVNSTILNATISAQTVNLFVDQSGDLNATDPFTIATDEISEHPTNATIDVEVHNANNYAYVTNTLNSLADSGNNSVQNGGSATVSTGNAYSLVNLINTVNFTIVNSTIHVVTINVFGNLNGNIILPDANATTNCSSCGVDLTTTNNSATVTNNETATATSGQNSITATGGTNAIQTGTAQNAIDNQNIVNSSISNVTIESLILRVLGSWNGNFLGWGNLTPTTGGNTLQLTNMSGNATGSGGGTSDVANNTAVVDNEINSTANTGGNTITSSQGNITTGNAYNEISLLNLINSNFANVTGFFGFINIFGTWNGDIGQESAFVTPTPTPSPEVQIANNSNTTQESGGLLSLTQTNNVGAYVLPGDTVTFFMQGRNSGIGKVYGTSVSLHLFHNGTDMGGTSFSLGDLGVSKSFRISTGLVLSKNAPTGSYTAVAIATGTTGPNNTQVSAESDSNFTIFGTGTTIQAYISGTPPTGIPQKVVLGVHTSKATPQSDALLLFILFAVLAANLIIRGIRNREMLKDIWTNSSSFKQRVLTLRLLLL